jgi:predicted membrane protein
VPALRFHNYRATRYARRPKTQAVAIAGGDGGLARQVRWRPRYWVVEQLLNAELGLRHVVIEGIWIFAAMEVCRIAVGVFVAIVLVQILQEGRNFPSARAKGDRHI